MNVNNNTTSQMTAQQRIQVEIAIAQCDRYITKEGSRRADLRSTDVQKRLDGYIAHRAKLQRALDTNSEDELTFPE